MGNDILAYEVFIFYEFMFIFLMPLKGWQKIPF